MTHRQIRFTKSADITKNDDSDQYCSGAYPNYEELFEYAKVRKASLSAVADTDESVGSSRMASGKVSICKHCDSLKVPERTQSVRQAKSQPRSCLSHHGHRSSGGSGSARHRSPRMSDCTQSVVSRDQASRRSLKGQPTQGTMERPSSRPESPPLDEDAVTRLRTFTLDPKVGLINRGDSFRSRSPVPSSESVPNFKSDSKSSTALSSRAHSPVLAELAENVAKYDIFVIGAEGVGKTALINQFRTSEYCTLYKSVDSAEFENTVSVVLDSEESEMLFSECDYEKNDEWKTASCSGYLIVYSIDKESTFKKGVKVLKYLRQSEKFAKTIPIVFVGNKVDLERRRYVTTEEGKTVAKEHDCKFVETSVAIGHNVDKLLAGILTQVRRISRRYSVLSQDGGDKDGIELGEEASGKRQKLKLRACLSGTSANCSNFQTARQLINRLSFKKKKNSKSVEDLFSLNNS